MPTLPTPTKTTKVDNRKAIKLLRSQHGLAREWVEQPDGSLLCGDLDKHHQIWLIEPKNDIGNHWLSVRWRHRERWMAVASSPHVDCLKSIVALSLNALFAE